MSATAQALFLNGACQSLLSVSICVGITQSMFGSSVHIRTLQYRCASQQAVPKCMSAGLASVL